MKFIAFTAPVIAVQLFKTFPVTVLVGAAPPSVKFNPVMVDVPASVMFEKLLSVQIEIQPATEDPLSVTRIVLPETPDLVNDVTIALLVTVLVVVANPENVSEIKVVVPVVKTFNAVNVFPLISEDKTTAVL